MPETPSTWTSRFLAAIITGIIAAAFLSVVVILPAMLIIWAVAGFPPARAWAWVYGTLAAATLANALRHAFFPRNTTKDRPQNHQGAAQPRA